MRHNTILHHPIIGMMYQNALLDAQRLTGVGNEFVRVARELTVGRYLSSDHADRVYHPIGYEISARRTEEDRLSGATEKSLKMRSESMAAAADKRLAGN
jgi:hypothetical protein